MSSTLDPAEEESDVGPLFGSSDGGVVRGISAEASRVLRKPLFWVGLGLFVINIKMVKPPWFPLFLLVNSVSAAERTIVTLVCILFAYLLLPFFAVICVLNGAEFVRACGSTTAYVAHGFAPECTPACGLGCYLAGFESFCFASLLVWSTRRLELSVRPHVGCCPAACQLRAAPLSSRLLLERFWRQCRIAALSKALTWFCLFPLAIAIEPTYRAIYAEQGMMQGGHPVMFDADITNSDPWTIGLTPFDVLTFLGLGLVGPVAITQPLGALMYGPPPGPPRETSSA